MIGWYSYEGLWVVCEPVFQESNSNIEDTCHHSSGRGKNKFIIRENPCHHSSGRGKNVFIDRENPCHHSSGRGKNVFIKMENPFHHSSGRGKNVFFIRENLIIILVVEVRMYSS